MSFDCNKHAEFAELIDCQLRLEIQGEFRYGQKVYKTLRLRTADNYLQTRPIGASG